MLVRRWLNDDLKIWKCGNLKMEMCWFTDSNAK
jgi:hypothetical protein